MLGTVFWGVLGPIRTDRTNRETYENYFKKRYYSVFVRFEALWRSWVTRRARLRGSAATLAVVGHEVVGVVGHVDVGLRVVWLLLAGDEALLAPLAPPAAEAGQEEQRHGGDLESF